MFGISGEHLLVLVVILLIFGPRRLPDLGASLGRTLRNFKDAMNNSGEPAATLPPKTVVAPAVTAQPETAPAEVVAAATKPVEAPQNQANL